MTTDQLLQQAGWHLSNIQFEAADELLSRLLASQPGNLQARWLQVRSSEDQKKTENAQEHLRLLLMHARKDLAIIDQVAVHVLQKRYPLQPVLRAYEKYLEQHPQSATAAFNFAWYLAKDAQYEPAIALYERALALRIDAPEEVHLNVANIYMDRLHDYDRARTHLEMALALNPAYAAAYYNLGNLAEQVGDREDARGFFDRCLQADPGNESALARLADTHNALQEDDPLATRLIAAAENSNNVDVHFAVGKVYEQLQNYDQAWHHFSRGNALDQKHMPAYDPERAKSHFARIIAAGNSAALQTIAEPPSRDPVFICGMFRSGSTLLEQMLAAHPRFVAGGESEFFPRLVAKEFPAYPDGLDTVTIDQLRKWQKQHAAQSLELFGDTGRLTDKRPDNFLYLGLIKAVLPSAKFLVTERGWRDLATSVYSVRLGPGQNYATSLANIKHYVELQSGLIKHWEKELAGDLLRIRYEDLVLQPTDTLQGVLDWLGENWDDRCLAFHEMKNRVKTASVWQVREPLHKRSIGRWQNYRQQFIDVFGAEANA